MNIRYAYAVANPHLWRHCDQRPAYCTGVGFRAAGAKRQQAQHRVRRQRSDCRRCHLAVLQSRRARPAGAGPAHRADERHRDHVPVPQLRLGRGLRSAAGRLRRRRGEWNLVPGAYLAVPWGDRFSIGLGVNAPFGLKLAYDDGWVGRFQALSSEIETLNVNPSLAMRVDNRLSIGAGVSYQRLQAELTNAVNYSAVVAQGGAATGRAGQLPAAAAPGIIAANVGLEGGARVRGDDSGWGFNVGVLFDASDTTRIGLSYRSAIDYNVGGTVTFTKPSTVSNPVGASIVTAASAAGAPLSSGPVSVDLKVPDSALLSVQQRVGDKVTLLGDVGWTGWSTVQELRVVRDSGTTVSVTPERWRDVLRYALGASFELNPRLTLSAGTAYDNTPVPDATRAPRLRIPTASG